MIASETAALEASLVFVSDEQPGIRRKKAGSGFSYRDAAGKRITDRRVLNRIKALAVPPAWTDVWICPDAHGHLQATGRDAKGRKQYRYHTRWRELCEADKYEHLLDFGLALPRIRRRVRRDLELRGFPRERALATVVSLLESTMIRVGSEEYAAYERLLRSHDPSQSSCPSERRRAHVRVPRQVEGRTRSDRQRPARRPHRPSAPGPTGPTPVPVRRRRRGASAGAVRGRERIPPDNRRRRRHREGLSDLDGDAPDRHRVGRYRSSGIRPGDEAGDHEHDRRCRRGTRATPLPFAGGATCIRP